MFTRADLLEGFAAPWADPGPALEVHGFHAADFDSPSSEQTLWLFRGTKSHFKDALHFWFVTLQAQDWVQADPQLESYLQTATCTPLDEPGVQRVVRDHTGSLQRELPEWLERPHGFRRGLQVFDEWNDVAVMAEFDEAFAALFWWTTA